jgi:hypothetical protein
MCYYDTFQSCILSFSKVLIVLWSIINSRKIFGLTYTISNGPMRSYTLGEISQSMAPKIELKAMGDGSKARARSAHSHPNMYVLHIHS